MSTVRKQKTLKIPKHLKTLFWSSKSTMQKLAQGLLKCLQGRFWSKTPAFPNIPRFSPFSQRYYSLIKWFCGWWQKQGVVTAVCVCHRDGYLGVWGGGSPAPVCTAWQRVSPQWALAPPRFVLNPCQPYPALPNWDKLKRHVEGLPTVLIPS